MLPGLQKCNKEACNGHSRRDNIFTIFNFKNIEMCGGTCLFIYIYFYLFWVHVVTPESQMSGTSVERSLLVYDTIA